MTAPHGGAAHGGEAPHGPAKRWLVEAATQRLGFKAAALFLAIALWLAVTAEESAEQLVPVRLAIVLDSSLAIAGPRPEVRALVVGRRRELIKLYETAPVVRHAITGDAADTVHLPLRPGDVDLPPGVEAVVRDVQPRSIVVRLVRLRAVPSPSAVGPRPSAPQARDTADRAATLEGATRHDSTRHDSTRTDSTTIPPPRPDSAPARITARPLQRSAFSVRERSAFRASRLN